jgi:hypothetical protein
MVDLRSILAEHRPKNEKNLSDQADGPPKEVHPVSEIPDVFFDDILLRFKLTRIEILIMMSLYRSVWCRPNLYHQHGITPMFSYTSLSATLSIEIGELNQGLRNLENYGLLHTIRSGQYFVRKFLTKDWDTHFGQKYDDFEI